MGSAGAGASSASDASGTSGAGVPVAVSVAVSAGGESLASGEQPGTRFGLNKDWQTTSFTIQTSQGSETEIKQRSNRNLLDQVGTGTVRAGDDRKM